MDLLLRDLFGHQGWADSEHWRAIESHPPARDDQLIRGRLHHLHLVQRAFMWAVDDQKAEFVMSEPADFKSFDELKAFARETHAGINQHLSSVSDARLVEKVSIPWFKEPPLTITVGEALAQCAMHSQWHRGQNATRLRDLGGEPPTVDLIVWFWKGRPAAQW
jgi:uncharacterized damage-inducible protein DinB